MTSHKPDYLHRQGPYGENFPRVRSVQDLDGHRLTAAQVSAFRTSGFIHNIPILTSTQVGALRDAIEAIVGRQTGREDELTAFSQADPADPASRMTYMQGAWTITEAVHDLIYHPAITVKAAQLLGTSRVRFWHDQIFYKPPRHGGNVAWHQDYSYWQRSRPARHLTCWIGLDDSTVENGCLHTIPGSHTWPLLDPTTLLGNMDDLTKQLTPEQVAGFKPFACEQPCGTCSFHHDHLVHGSYANTSERPRRAIVLNFMADGVLSHAPDGRLMPGADPVPLGNPIAGRHFPLVIDLDVAVLP
jgi:ectoine hydroxylase-related dioxygenase (phytanoyl-CoA dioxygenase family)